MTSYMSLPFPSPKPAAVVAAPPSVNAAPPSVNAAGAPKPVVVAAGLPKLPKPPNPDKVKNIRHKIHSPRLIF